MSSKKEQPSKDQASKDHGSEPKSKKHRSPNYPSFSLETAVAKASVLYQRNKRHWIPAAAAMEQMDYKSNSSTGQQAIAALKSFGLIDDQGSGDKRQICVNERATKIILGAAAKPQMLQEAALLPPINSEVWEKFYKPGDGLAPDATIRDYLIFQRDVKFNPDSVGTFIAQLKNSASYANLYSLANTTELDGEPEASRAAEIKAGDWVQWTSQGQAQFPTPRKVLALSDDGLFAFVEGTDTGMPVDQLTIEKTPQDASAKAGNAPRNPFAEVATAYINYANKAGPAPQGVVEEVFAVGSKRIVIQFPNEMSAEEFQDVTDWFRILERKMKRTVKIEN